MQDSIDYFSAAICPNICSIATSQPSGHNDIAIVALLVSALTFFVNIYANWRRSKENASTRKISIFVASIDKYIAEISENLKSLESICDAYKTEARRALSYSVKNELYSHANRVRRSVNRLVNNIVMNELCDVGQWNDVDARLDDIMVSINRLKGEKIRTNQLIILDDVVGHAATIRSDVYGRRDALLNKLLKD